MGVLVLNRRDFLKAIKQFKKVRDIAEEAGNVSFKL